jgi:hypothetical protein
MNEQEKREKMAREHVQELKAFYGVLALYVIVNAVLFVVDMLTPGGTWFFWPVLGWGLGMGAWAVSLFGVWGRFGRDWEERKVREFIERDASRRI